MSRTAIALALVLLVAGCTAPTAQQSPPVTDAPNTTGESPSETRAETTTESAASTSGSAESTTEAPTDDALDIPVSGGSLPFAHEQVFTRTIELLDLNVSPPTVIVVKSPAEIRADTGGVSSPGSGNVTRSFAGVMGIGRDDGSEDDTGDDRSDSGDGEDDRTDDGDGSDEGVSVAAYTPSAHSVIVNERLTDTGRERVFERTLAHEFVHVVQFRQDAFDRVQRNIGLNRRYSRDRYLTYASVIEGTATYVGEEYDRRYLAGNSATISKTEHYLSSPSGVKYSIARYYFGRRYVASRFDSPANVSRIYEDPPRTTEQLLHEDANGSEEPRILTVEVRPGENRTVGRKNTNGELFTRIALGTELNESRAATAAAGWGADELVPVEPVNRSGNRSFVWATRWDSPAEATEFETALGEYLDSRANRSGELWRDGSLFFRVVRVSDETVVLLAGDEPFVRNATPTGTNGRVSVSVSG